MPELGEQLSERELEVLRCLASGSGNKEIAAELTISQNTVKVHLRNIYTKLGVSSRTEATTVALQQGVIAIPGADTAVTPAEGEQAGPAISVPADGPVMVDMPTTTTTRPAESDTTALEPVANQRLNWPLVGLLVGGLLVSLLAGIFIMQGRVGSLLATPTEAPFSPTDLGDNWQVIRPLPEPRSNLAAATVGLDVYAIAGETEDGVVDSVLVYHTTDHEWETAANKPTAVADVTAARLFGEIYVPGGRLANGEPTDIVEAYSPSTDRWRTVQSLPQPIAGGLALTDGSFLYLFGGWNGSQYLDSAYVYDPGDNSWRPLPSMSQARAYLSGGAVTSHLYAVGGFDGEQTLATCEYFNPADESWQTCREMLSPRTGAGAASIVNKLYVIGGSLDDDTSVAFSEMYDPDTETWNIINTPILSEDPNWRNFGVTPVEARLFTLGGQKADTAVADAYLFSPPVYQIFLPAASSGE